MIARDLKIMDVMEVCFSWAHQTDVAHGIHSDIGKSLRKFGKHTLDGLDAVVVLVLEEIERRYKSTLPPSQLYLIQANEVMKLARALEDKKLA